MKREFFWTEFQKVLKYQISWKRLQWQPSRFMLSEGHLDMTKLIVAFSNCVNAPNNVTRHCHLSLCYTHVRHWPIFSVSSRKTIVILVNVQLLRNRNWIKEFLPGLSGLFRPVLSSLLNSIREETQFLPAPSSHQSLLFLSSFLHSNPPLFLPIYRCNKSAISTVSDAEYRKGPCQRADGRNTTVKSDDGCRTNRTKEVSLPVRDSGVRVPGNQLFHPGMLSAA